VEAREETVAAPTDVATCSYLTTGSTGNGDKGALVEIIVGAAEGGAGAETVLWPVRRGLGAGHHADVDDGAARIAIYEVLVTVAAGTNCGAETLMDEALESLGDVVRVIDESDAAGAVSGGGGETGVLSVGKAVEADVAGGDNLNGHRKSLCRPRYQSRVWV
jgi:hypothetical protein